MHVYLEQTKVTDVNPLPQQTVEGIEVEMEILLELGMGDRNRVF